MTSSNRLRLHLPHLIPGSMDDMHKNLREIERFASNMLGPTQPWTPTWSASTGTTPAIGDGVLEGWYREIGDLIFINIYLEYDSTTTLGGGAQIFSLPFPASDRPNRQSIGGNAFDVSSTTERYPINGSIVAGEQTISRTAVAPNGTLLGATNPGGSAWADGDFIVYTGFYFAR